jgi:hypothetical protein
MLQATQESAPSASPLPLHDLTVAFSLPSSIHLTTSSPRSNSNSLLFNEDEDDDHMYEGQIDLNSIESILQSSFSKCSNTPPATPPSRVILPNNLATLPTARFL